MHNSQPHPDQPLTTEQRRSLDQLVQALDGGQLIWASGYLAGLATGSAGPSVQRARPQPDAQLIYASETGNGAQIADALAHRAVDRQLALNPVSVADFRASDLSRAECLYFVVSTHGEGDPPEEAAGLFRYLKRERAPRLEQLSYAVLALGDRSYEHFCAAGRWLDERLAALGATRIMPRVECDVDYQDQAEGWGRSALEDLSNRTNRKAEGSAGNVIAMPLATRVPQSSATGTRQNPAAVEVLEHVPLTTPDAARQVFHLELGVGDHPLHWAPGDALAVIHHNPEPVIAAVLEATGANPDATIEHRGDSMTLHQALDQRLEITGLHLGFLERYAQACGNPRLREALDQESGEALRRLIRECQVIDILRRWPGQLTAEQLAHCLRPLVPRLYSIASAAEATPDEVHLTVAHLTDERNGDKRIGAASTYLCQMLDVGAVLAAYVHPNRAFHLPEDDAAPLIMIGAGTGIAPFRAFLEARQAHGSTARNWLLFGNRNLQADFLYQTEWLRRRADGMLDRLDVIFSRDRHTGGGRYVQDLLDPQGKALRSWLDDGAHLYVCGSIAMGAAVHQRLIQVLGPSGAEALDALAAEQRYHRDVY